tara:strand:+ start:737 stop:1813 length:1077 start_codon:yes stop_codon:yes gene_type:complete
MRNNVAFITGVTGQDGAYLTEFLIKKGYIVHGLKRRSSSLNTHRIDHIYQEPQATNKNFLLHYGDMTDSANIIRLISKIEPNEIYNLAAMSHVKVSFDLPEYTADVNALGTLRILEAIRILNLEKKIKYYQASTSELYGEVKETPQNENTPFNPQSPYAISKLYSYWIVKNYRKAYNIHASNGILFNHESPIRGETFVTRKITIGICKIVLGIKDKIYLGNIDSKRDWGYAKEYVEAMWLILQQKKADDWVIASGKSARIRDVLKIAFEFFEIDIYFVGKGINEVAKVRSCNNPKYKLELDKTIMEIDKKYYRPSDVNTLTGDATKAKEKLGWQAKTDIKDLINIMIKHDFNVLTKKR